jgi:hypothetical protein
MLHTTQRVLTPQQMAGTLENAGRFPDGYGMTPKSSAPSVQVGTSTAFLNKMGVKASDILVPPSILAQEKIECSIPTDVASTRGRARDVDGIQPTS